MSIVAVRERRGYEHDYAFGKLAPHREFKRFFWVYSSVRNEDPLVIRGATGVPQPGAVHPTDTGCIVQKVSLRREEERPDRWEVDVTYTNDLRDIEKDPPDVTTLTRISVVSRGGSRLVDRDLDNVPTLNTAGDLLENFNIEWSSLGLQIEQYVLSEPTYYAVSGVLNGINTDTWRGVPPYFAKITSMSFEKDKVEGITCWKRTTVVDLTHSSSRPQGWRQRKLNAGLRALSVPGGTLRGHVRDEKTLIFLGRETQLKADGTQALKTDAPYYIDFRIYPEIAFSGVGI